MKTKRTRLLYLSASTHDTSQLVANLSTSWSRRVTIERYSDIGPLLTAGEDRQFDILICDMSHPVLVGPPTLLTLRAALPELPIVAITHDDTTQIEVFDNEGITFVGPQYLARTNTFQAANRMMHESHSSSVARSIVPNKWPPALPCVQVPAYLPL